MSRKLLAADSGVSERYLAQLEGGLANASLLVLQHVARALDVPLTRLVSDGSVDREARRKRIALIGLRGAGKSTLGAQLAAQLRVPFIELDREVEREAGVSLSAVFELYGQAGFRRYERQSLDAVLRAHPRFVLATGGSIVSEPGTYELLLRACYTVWIKAAAEEHMSRVIAQGDYRPMAGNAEAMADLRSILAERDPLYAKADAVVDTTGQSEEESLNELLRAAGISPECAARLRA